MKNQKQAGKMCKFYDKKGYKVLGGQLIAHCRSIFKGGIKCPKGTDNACQIITPKKKKSGVVRVKAWAILFDDGTPLEAHAHKHSDRLCGMNTVPCVILVERKHMGGNHGKR